MCDLCETRKRVERADRVIRALKGGSPINPDALAALLLEVRNDLVTRHNHAIFQHEMAKGVASIVAELEAAEKGEEPVEPNATHCNPGSIN